LFIFFFQAEDGIRDFHVTGVQTCALPILDAARISLLRRLLSGAVQPIVIDADGLNALSQIDDWCGLIRGRSKRSGGVVLTPHPEIGRASCRERGESWVGTVAG